MRMMIPMKSHLNRCHTINFRVLHGFVNHKNDVSGRLSIEINKIKFSVI